MDIASRPGSLAGRHLQHQPQWWFFAALFIGCQQPARAALSCGAQPEIAVHDGAEPIKGDATGRADLILHAPPSVNLRSLVTAQRRQMRQKYADVEKALLDSYLLWTTCQTISNDEDLVGSQKFDLYSNVYRLLSEPIDKGAPTTE